MRRYILEVDTDLYHFVDSNRRVEIVDKSGNRKKGH